MDPKGDLFDENPGPNLGGQLPLADHFTRMLDKDEQDIERAAAKLDRLTGLLENALGGKQSKRPKGDDLLGSRAARWNCRLQDKFFFELVADNRRWLIGLSHRASGGQADSGRPHSARISD
jgi:hypothetical protein